MSSFKISHYRKTLESYKQAGYSFVSIDDHSAKLKQVAMVHDVDHNLDLVRNFSATEESVGVMSTYFLRLHAVNYNMLSKKSIDTVKREILDRNHDVGLHFEPSFYRNDDIEKSIERNLEILSNALKKEVTKFNIHEPFRTGFDLKNLIPSKNRCYNSSFFKDFKYLSDSSCNWREGCFSEHIGKWQKILVLTHPIWWYNEDPTENY